MRARPQLEALFLLVALVQAAFLLIGGVLGDTLGRRRVLVTSLTLLALAEVGAIVLPDGPGFVIFRLVGAAMAGIALPVALVRGRRHLHGCDPGDGAWHGLRRAGRCGGGGSCATPRRDAHHRSLAGVSVAALAMLVALWAVRRNVPPSPLTGLPLRAIAPHSLWAFGLLALMAGLVGFRANSELVIRFALILGGVLLVLVFLVVQRRKKGVIDEYAIDLRPTTVALVAGFALALAQTAPALELPLFFQISQNYSALLATLALAPFIVALFAAGPIAGLLLTRFSPRALIAGGLAVVGAADLLFSLFGPGTPYLFFIVPFFAVGAGFVIGTSVRTAVIFASVTRRLPATAAALNQTSLVVGSQAAVAGMTAFIASTAVAWFTATLPPGTDAESAVAGINQFLQAIGTSEFGQLIQQLDPATGDHYGAAFAAGVRMAMFFAGAVAVITAPFVWFALRTDHDPIETVWEHREERSQPKPSEEVATA